MELARRTMGDIDVGELGDPISALEYCVATAHGIARRLAEVLRAIQASAAARRARTAQRLAAGVKYCQRLFSLTSTARPARLASPTAARPTAAAARSQPSTPGEASRTLPTRLALPTSWQSPGTAPRRCGSAAPSSWLTRPPPTMRSAATPAAVTTPRARRLLEASGSIEPRPPRQQPVRVPSGSLPVMPEPPDWSRGWCTRVDS